MPIKNEKGLAALRALSEGGSPGLQAYKQSQQAEQASRTTALQNALGGQDVAAAAAKAQAQYAPQIANAGLGIDNLNVAADSYLSRASNKLAAQKYEDQQNLTLQAEALRRQQNEISQQERMQQLQGAADIMAEQQRGDLEANFSGNQQLNNLAIRKANLRDQLTAYDQSMAPNLTTAALSGNPANVEQIKAGREDILRQMGALDQQFQEASGQYAGLLGTDNKGFLDAYAAADRGDVEAIKALNEYLNPTREAVLGQQSRAIDAGEQQRLRDLAPAFGINELTAAGMFREGEGKGLQREQQRQAEAGYIAGQSPDVVADQFGFADAKDLNAAKKATGLDEQGIADTMSDPAWRGVDDLAQAFVANDQTNPLIAGTEDRETRRGIEGFRAALQDYAAEQVPMPEGATEDQKRQVNQARTQIINLAINRYKPAIAGAAGTGVGLKEESE